MRLEVIEPDQLTAGVLLQFEKTIAIVTNACAVRSLRVRTANWNCIGRKQWTVMTNGVIGGTGIIGSTIVKKF